MSYYIVIPQTIYGLTDLSVNAKLLYGYLSSVASKTGINHSTNEQIENDIKLSAHQTRRALTELENNKLVEIEIIRGNFRRVIIVDLVLTIKHKAKIKKEKTKVKTNDWVDNYLNELEGMN